MSLPRSSWTLAAVLLLRLAGVSSLSSLRTPVTEPIQEQAGKVVEWATEAKQAAARAGADAQKVKEAGIKASGSITGALAEVGAAKQAMEQAVVQEKKISTLRDQIWQQAKEAAMAEIPKVLPELRKKAQKKADDDARRMSKAFEKRMKKKAGIESVKASKVYEDVMAGAGKSAADYAKLGDSLVSQAATMQMNAGLAQGQAGQYITMGSTSEAQKLMQQSRQDMNVAFGLNAQATGMYDTSAKITAQLPAYAGQAAAAAYHAQVMYDPDAPPPPQPLV